MTNPSSLLNHQYKNNGKVQLFPLNQTASVPNVEYDVYYEVYDYFLQVQTKVTLGGTFIFTQNCDYSDGDCPNLVDVYYNQLILLPPEGVCGPVACKPITPVTWDLSYYRQNYSVNHFNTLIQMILRS